MTAGGSRTPRRALTARFVETVSKPGKYHDGQGLILRVRPNGAKQWVLRITIRGKRCELGLGRPPAIPLATARKLALEYRGAAMMGRDPKQERREARAGLTFDAAVDRYLAAKLEEFRNEKHKAQWRSILDRYARPVLGQQLRYRRGQKVLVAGEVAKLLEDVTYAMRGTHEVRVDFGDGPEPVKISNIEGPA